MPLLLLGKGWQPFDACQGYSLGSGGGGGGGGVDVVAFFKSEKL